MFEHDVLQLAVNNSYQSFSQAEGGKNADYILFLAGVDPSLSGLAVVTAKGDVFTAGDTAYRFAIESISKVCTLALALALEDYDPQTIQQKIGADPTGLPFNSVIALELHGDKPLSPLVNAGAMSTTSLVKPAQQRIVGSKF